MLRKHGRRRPARPEPATTHGCAGVLLCATQKRLSYATWVPHLLPSNLPSIVLPHAGPPLAVSDSSHSTDPKFDGTNTQALHHCATTTARRSARGWDCTGPPSRSIHLASVDCLRRVYNSFLDYYSPACQCAVPAPSCISARTRNHSASCSPAPRPLAIFTIEWARTAYRNQCAGGRTAPGVLQAPLHGEAVMVYTLDLSLYYDICSSQAPEFFRSVSSLISSPHRSQQPVFLSLLQWHFCHLSFSKAFLRHHHIVCVCSYFYSARVFNAAPNTPVWKQDSLTPE
jgi:hypothetical protein